MNRKRHEGESFKKYRRNIAAEERALKAHLRGYYIHQNNGRPYRRPIEKFEESK